MKKRDWFYVAHENMFIYWANDLKSDHFLGCEISKIIERSTDMNQESRLEFFIFKF